MARLIQMKKSEEQGQNVWHFIPAPNGAFGCLIGTSRSLCSVVWVPISALHCRAPISAAIWTSNDDWRKSFIMPFRENFWVQDTCKHQEERNHYCSSMQMTKWSRVWPTMWTTAIICHFFRHFSANGAPRRPFSLKQTTQRGFSRYWESLRAFRRPKRRSLDAQKGLAAVLLLRLSVKKDFNFLRQSTKK